MLKIPLYITGTRISFSKKLIWSVSSGDTCLFLSFFLSILLSVNYVCGVCHKSVKSLITFVIFCQISCGKVQKNPHIFLHKRLCQRFSWVAIFSQITSNKWRKKRKDLHHWVHTSIVWGNLENCSEPRRNFYTVFYKAWCFGCLSGPPGFTCWISFAPVLFTVESLSLLYLLVISWFICLDDALIS